MTENVKDSFCSPFGRNKFCEGILHEEISSKICIENTHWDVVSKAKILPAHFSGIAAMIYFITVVLIPRNPILFYLNYESH